MWRYRLGMAEITLKHDMKPSQKNKQRVLIMRLKKTFMSSLILPLYVDSKGHNSLCVIVRNRTAD